MKKMCVFTLYDEKGGSSQYRAYIFKQIFEKNFKVKWFYFWNNTYATKYTTDKKKYIFQIGFNYVWAIIKRIYQLCFIAPYADIIFIQKACIPKIKKTFLRRIKEQGKKIVFDIDDATYLLPYDNTSDIAKNADVVICGNETLREYYKTLGCKCVVLPTVENTFKYEQYWKDTFDTKIIGWIGSSSSLHNLELIVEPLNRIVEKHPEIQIHIICNDDQGYCSRIKNSKLIIWDSSSYIADMSKFTIGVMPLEDTDFNRGKCGFKLIQYLNMKKPVIGSGIGVNREIISGNGVIADSTTDWENAFEELLYQKEKYLSYVLNIENEFFEKYHFKVIADQMIEILDGEE